MKKTIFIILGVVIITLVTIVVLQLTGTTHINFTETKDKVLNPPVAKVDDQPKVKVLDLSNKGLGKVPTYVFEDIGLEELNISNNEITVSIQSEVRNLTKLKVLNASNNLMSGVPAEIGQLENLEVLDLSNNQLTGLPNELGNLKNLKTLNISGNNYSQQDLDYIINKLPSTVNIIK